MCPPNRFFPCCAKTVSSRLMKLSDFYYNYVRHHLKWFSVNNNLGYCHANTFVKERLGKNFSSSLKKWPFSPSKRIYIGIFGSNSKSAPRI